MRTAFYKNCTKSFLGGQLTVLDQLMLMLGKADLLMLLLLAPGISQRRLERCQLGSRTEQTRGKNLQKENPREGQHLVPIYSCTKRFDLRTWSFFQARKGENARNFIQLIFH